MNCFCIRDIHRKIFHSFWIKQDPKFDPYWKRKFKIRFFSFAEIFFDFFSFGFVFHDEVFCKNYQFFCFKIYRVTLQTEEIIFFEILLDFFFRQVFAVFSEIISFFLIFNQTTTEWAIAETPLWFGCLWLSVNVKEPFTKLIKF